MQSGMMRKLCIYEVRCIGINDLKVLMMLNYDLLSKFNEEKLVINCYKQL